MTFFLAPAAHAQITVSCKVVPATAAQNEEVEGIITIGNNTGTELELFTTNAACDVVYSIRDQDDVELRTTSDHFLARPVRLAASATLTITNNLLDCFNLQKIGSFKVYGKAVWDGKEFTSERAFLDIVPGIELQRVEAGISGGGSRIYSLRMINRERFDHLLMRIDDEAGGVCYGVFDLGRWVHTETPELKIDGQGNVHILYQSGPVQFVHRAFSPFGQMIDDTTYSNQRDQLRLEAGAGGTVEVSGHAPPPEPEEKTADDGEQPKE